MNELFTYLFDEEILRNSLGPKWIEILDYEYIDQKITIKKVQPSWVTPLLLCRHS